jgi:hypothetical protein
MRRADTAQPSDFIPSTPPPSSNKSSGGSGNKHHNHNNNNNNNNSSAISQQPSLSTNTFTRAIQGLAKTISGTSNNNNSLLAKNPSFGQLPPELSATATSSTLQSASNWDLIHENSNNSGSSFYDQRRTSLPNHNLRDATNTPPASPSTRAAAAAFTSVLGREFSQRSTQTLVMAIVIAILIVLLIVWVSGRIWEMIEPYSFPLVGACIMSIALHEPPEHSKDPSRRNPVTKSIIGAKERFRLNWPRLGKYFSPLVAIPEFFHQTLQKSLCQFGIDKYPLIDILPEWLQNISFFFLLISVTARLSRFLFPSFFVGLLFSAAVLGGVPLAISFIICWFTDERQFVRTIRMLTSILTIGVISLTFTISIVDELHQGGRSSVAAIQNLGIEIPDNAAEVASSYVLSPNTTERLLPALREFRFNGTWDEIYNHTREFLTNHTTTLSAAISESQPVAKGVSDVVTNILKFTLTLLVWSFGKIYEVVLFWVTLNNFLSLDRTILYYVLRKGLTVVFADEHKADAAAEATEVRMIGELSALFYSLFHVFVCHFCLTLLWYSLFSMPLSVLFSTIGGLIALFPLSLPPVITQLIIACIVMLIRQNFEPVMLLTGLCVWIATMSVDLIAVSEKDNPRVRQQMKKSKSGPNIFGSSIMTSLTNFSSKGRSSSSKNENNNNNNSSGKSHLFETAIAAAQSNIAKKDYTLSKASSYMITTSIILGLTAYGVNGVVLGPLLFIVAHQIWDAFQ